ncbi:MAG: hypothetical protein RIR79_1881 [Pseudomonadota bacterium]|jgi:hypothetical protein
MSLFMKKIELNLSDAEYESLKYRLKGSGS